jgi:hypothetical protein
MVAGEIAPHASPAGIVSLRLTVPLNPFSPDMVTVEEAEIPATTAFGDVAEIVKSVTVTEIVRDC